MPIGLCISEPSPEDWPRRRRVKALLREAAARGLRETLLIHSRSLFGLEVWSLSNAQLDELTTTFCAVCTVLDEQLQSRELH